MAEALRMGKRDHHALKESTWGWRGQEFATLRRLAVPERMADAEEEGIG